MSQFYKYIVAFCFLLVLGQLARAQEHTAAVGCNPALYHQPATKALYRTTSALTLPFFEDFTDNSPYPNSARWQDREAFVNNTFGFRPISKGVATLDALNEHGVPYDTFSNYNFRYADSLTSQSIDLSTSVPGDSLYLSFFYQPQGNGFYPLEGDSIILYMKLVYGGWMKIWSAPGTALQPFKQVMIPITDTLYMHSNFSFRFVNIAALNFCNAHWNVDYIRLDKNRNMYDTAISDIGYTTTPSFLLNDYTSMPYRQFYANRTAEMAHYFYDSVANLNLMGPYGITENYVATALNTGATLHASAGITQNLAGSSVTGYVDTAYTSVITPPADPYASVVFENKFYIQQTANTGSTGNDTTVRKQVFDNYLAYDDGSAEQAYYLTLYPTLPGEISIEHHLNVADTMKGMAIYFARQVPRPSYKTFYIKVYSELAGVNGAVADNVLYTQRDCTPGYIDSIDEFYNYKFDTPLPLPAGTFYAGIFLLAESGDDSLYFGLDLNRIGGNHTYYKVFSDWNPSLIQGAVMMRPLLGKNFVGSGVQPVRDGNTTYGFSLVPNPANTTVRIQISSEEETNFELTDVAGRVVRTGSLHQNADVDISSLQPGIYLVRLSQGGVSLGTQKLIKQ